jgi:hypothetical protein
MLLTLPQSRLERLNFIVQLPIFAIDLFPIYFYDNGQRSSYSSFPTFQGNSTEGLSHSSQGDHYNNPMVLVIVGGTGRVRTGCSIFGHSL